MKLKLPFAVILSGIWLGSQCLKCIAAGIYYSNRSLLLVGAALILLIVFFLLLQNWARLLLIFFMVYTALTADAVQVIRMGINDSQVSIRLVISIADAIVEYIVLPILAIFLLTRPKVKELFGIKKIADESTVKP